MDPWLNEALNYIPAWLDHQMKRSTQPGCAVAIAHKGKVVLNKAYGFADTTTNTKLKTTHRFRAASHSKSFTAAAIMKLREAGRLRLDDPVGTYVSGLYPDIAETTIGQLLSHSAGLIRDGMDTGQWQDRRPFLSTVELREALAEPPIMEASSRFKYSNPGFGLLGLVIEVITGEPYIEWVGREVIATSKLKNSQADAPLAPRTPFASGHSGKLPVGHRVVIPADNQTLSIAPAAGVIATASDLVRFFASLDPAAKTSILTPASRREMVRRHWHDAESSVESYYGLGIMIGKTGDWEWFGHSGGFQGCVSRTVVVPGKDLAVSVLTNAVDGPASTWSDGILHILRAFKTGGAPSDETLYWGGRWWSLWGVIDLVPMAKHVAIAGPSAVNPFSGASEITVAGKDVGWITKSGGYGSHGEGVRLVRGRTGKIREVWIAGTQLLPEARMKAELKEKYER